MSIMRYIAIVNHYRCRDSRDITIVIVVIISDLHKNGINNPSILFYSWYYQLSYKGVACKSFTKVHIHRPPTQLINKCPVHAK